MTAGETAPGTTGETCRDGSAGRGGSADGEAEVLARVALSRIAEPGDEVVGRSVRELGAAEVLRLLTGGGRLPGATERRMDGYRIRARGQDLDPAADVAAVRALGGRFVPPGDGEWPGQLDDLGDQRPLGLWVRGRPSLRLWALRSVAVVGARACSAYGTHVATTLGAELAEAGWAVVSGAAYGVDAAVHRGALAVGGPTAAVVAAGLDSPYPRGHAGLLERIAEQGLVIGELAPGEHPTRSRFVLRNRVIAALTRGTVVVEAELRSGSLITARRARDTGRHLMGVPGPVTSRMSQGVHQLLRDGAVPVTCAAEVVELVGSIGADLAPERRGPLLPRDLLAPAAARVLDALPARGPAGEAEVARAAGVGLDETRARLHELLTLGFVRRCGPHWRLAPRGANPCTPVPPWEGQHAAG
ncbi:DNA-processing protein DprA [Streptomyces thermolineatus]|uniref:DNA-processing protein DprA n=1 Tax=Streptomyces thermolineatus TaxID=44033 RepID=A0ABN3M021_9ACTN